jgi:hypothetical protein
MTIKTNKKSIMTLIIEEMFSLRVSGFFLYLMKIGMKAELNAPVMMSSNTKSGIRNAAKNISSSSLVK